MRSSVPKRLVGRIGGGKYSRAIASCVPPETTQWERQRDVVFPSGALQGQIRSHGWAPPAYTNQKDLRRKKKSSGSRKKSRRSSKKKQRVVASESEPKTIHQDSKPHHSHFHRQKISRLQGDLLKLIESYAEVVTSVQDDDYTVLESYVAGATSTQSNDDYDLWDQSKQVLEALDDFETVHSTDNLDNTRDTIISTQQTYKEICRLMHRLISVWSKPNLFPSMRDNNEQTDTQPLYTASDPDEVKEEVVYIGLDDDHPSPPAPHDMAEELLRKLVKIQQARNQFVSSVQEEPATENEDTQPVVETWIDWFRDIFVFSKGDHGTAGNDVEERSQAVPDEADKEEPSAGTTITSALLCRVLHAIIRESNVQHENDGSVDFDAVDQDYTVWNSHFRRRKWGPGSDACFHQKELADRLSNLVDACSAPGDFVMDSQVLEILVHAHASVGLVSNVAQAEKLCRATYTQERQQAQKQFHKRSSLFHTLLQGYRLAATLESHSQRANAAKNAEWLLKNQQLRSSKVRPADKSQSNRPKVRKSTIVSYKLVLQALVNPGEDALPDMSDRAEKLMEQLVGKKEFRQLVDVTDPPEIDKASPLSVDLGILHYLIVIYSRSNQLDKAKRLLELMEANHHADGVLENSNGTSANGVTFPNTWTYSAILAGMIRYSGTNNSDPDVLLDNALYGTSLLDSMEQVSCSFPSQDMYRMVLKLWAKSRSAQAGDRALRLLSRMEVTSAATGYSWMIDYPSYEAALKCLTLGALVGQRGAAQRAVQLLHKLQAQSHPLSNSFELETPCDEDTVEIVLKRRDVLHYNDVRPYLKLYNYVIETCKNTACRSDHDEALRFAFETYNLMLDRGIVPSAHTIVLLIRCCTNLLSPDDERRQDLIKTVFQAACDQNLVNRRVLRHLRDADEDLYTAYSEGQLSGDEMQDDSDQTAQPEKSEESDEIDDKVTEA